MKMMSLMSNARRTDPEWLMVLYKNRFQNMMILFLLSIVFNLEADNTIPKNYTINYYNESPYTFQSGNTRDTVSAIEFFADKNNPKNVKFFLNGISRSSREIYLILSAMPLGGKNTPLVVVYSGGEKGVLNELELIRKNIYELGFTNFRITENPDLEMLLKNKNKSKAKNNQIVNIELKYKGNQPQERLVKYWILGKPWDRKNAFEVLEKMSKSKKDNITINLIYAKEMLAEGEILYRKCKDWNFPYITKNIIENPTTKRNPRKKSGTKVKIR